MAKTGNFTNYHDQALRWCNWDFSPIDRLTSQFGILLVIPNLEFSMSEQMPEKTRAILVNASIAAGLAFATS
jgi:hypothetical protein